MPEKVYLQQRLCLLVLLDFRYGEPAGWNKNSGCVVVVAAVAFVGVGVMLLSLLLLLS